MLHKRLFLLGLLCMLSLDALSQAVDNTLSFKNINSDRYVRFNYENDVFSGTDMYYTQGINLEWAWPAIRDFFATSLLLNPHFDNTRYMLGIQHNGYTPTSISSDFILPGDRPFSACLFAQLSLLAIDTIKQQRFSSTLSAGVMGPAAGGMEMQVGIHKWLHNITPHGWQYQLHNDAILNYQTDYEKQLFAIGKYFLIDAMAMARIGTLSDKAAIGSTLLIGYFSSPYSAAQDKEPLHIYAYEHPGINLVGYDATLQGGLFNHSSPYSIPSADITRFTFENRFGFVVNWRKLHLEYFQSLLSAEFKTGNYHVWGGIQIATTF